jgi:hypothetical protein
MAQWKTEMKTEYLKSEGTFECVVSKPESGWFGESGQKKTPYVRLDLTVENDPEESGKIAQWYGYLSDKAIDGTITRLTEAFGFDGDLNALNSGASTFDGMKCQITTELESYEGKDRLKVKWLNPFGYSKTSEPMDKSSLASLLSRLNGKAKSAAIAAKSTMKSNPSQPPVHRDDSDVPF